MRASLGRAGVIAGAALGASALVLWAGPASWLPASWWAVVAAGAASWAVVLLMCLAGALEGGDAPRGRWLQAALLGMAGGLAVVVREGDGSALPWIVGVGLAAALAGLVRGTVGGAGAHEGRGLVLVALGMVAFTAVLRLALPGSPLVAFVLAPACFLLAPGLALGRLLLPDATLGERLLQAPPLSFGAVLLVLVWLDAAGIRASPGVVLATCGALTALGALDVDHRSAP